MSRGTAVLGGTLALTAYTVWWVFNDKAENKALMRAGMS